MLINSKNIYVYLLISFVLLFLIPTPSVMYALMGFWLTAIIIRIFHKDIGDTRG